jgi:histidine triad (HIT) family protein
MVYPDRFNSSYNDVAIFTDMTDCIFCKIIAGKSPHQLLYQDELVSAFRDHRPVAPVHVLVVPNKHIASVNDLTPEDEALMGHLVNVARELARQEGVDHSGYRLVVNTGPQGGQGVYHIHLHLLGGRQMHALVGSMD